MGWWARADDVIFFGMLPMALVLDTLTLPVPWPVYGYVCTRAIHVQVYVRAKARGTPRRGGGGGDGDGDVIGMCPRAVRAPRSAHGSGSVSSVRGGKGISRLGRRRAWAREGVGFVVPIRAAGASSQVSTAVHR